MYSRCAEVDARHVEELSDDQSDEDDAEFDEEEEEEQAVDDAVAEDRIVAATQPKQNLTHIEQLELTLSSNIVKICMVAMCKASSQDFIFVS
jgi:hypothetical protein